nr:unnamed protein product [Callosobruchus analis]
MEKQLFLFDPKLCLFMDMIIGLPIVFKFSAALIYEKVDNGMERIATFSSEKAPIRDLVGTHIYRKCWCSFLNVAIQGNHTHLSNVHLC